MWRRRGGTRATFPSSGMSRRRVHEGKFESMSDDGENLNWYQGLEQFLKSSTVK